MSNPSSRTLLPNRSHNSSAIFSPTIYSSYENPSSLVDLCVETICDFVNDEYVKPASPVTYPCKYVVQIKDDLFLPESLAEKLLKAMCRKEILNCITATLFSPKNTRLRHVRGLKTYNLSFGDLKIFCGHNLKTFHLEHSQLPANEVLAVMNEWTNNNLEVLNLSGCSVAESFQRKYRYSVNLEKFRNLKELDVSYTEFHFHNLIAIIEDLPFLESLNISHSKVDSIAPLKNCKQNFKKLGLAGLRLTPIPQVFPFRTESPTDIVLNMTNLQHLDVSFDERAGIPFDTFMSDPGHNHIFKVMDAVDKLPNLVSLDVSGQEQLGEATVVSFIETHPHLQFLGLLHTNVCNIAIFDPSNSRYRSNLKVAGISNLEQVIIALKMCKRVNYIQPCLYKLYSLSEQDKLGPRPDILELVVNKMRSYQNKLTIQLAGTACLYNLTKCGVNDRQNAGLIPQKLLAAAVSLTLDAMECFPEHYQLQKNALLTLCNDRILQETPMDRFRCAQLVLDALCSFNNEQTDRLCVAISSIVASKISSEETTKIGSVDRYMKKLLLIVKRKVYNLSVDSTLGFALSTLWNLSDESPLTCMAFLREEGLILFIDMLSKYKHNESILTKILGLLNNIAEVRILRKFLVTNEIIEPVRSLLKSNSIEISYFSGGVFAHLLTGGADNWDPKWLPPCNQILDELEAAILSWKQPNKEMVAYRSFKPFLPLLLSYQTHQAQLWALWAIQHVLTAHGQRYSEMLIAEGIREILQELVTCSNIVEPVSSRARAILDQLQDFKTRKITNFKF